IAMNIGGLYTNEVKATDIESRFSNVPKDYQKKALNMLFSMADDLDWLDSKDVLEKLPGVGKPSRTILGSLIEYIMNAPAAASLSDGVVSKEFSATDCLDMIYSYVFKSTIASRKLSEKDQYLQSMFVEALMDMGGFTMMPSSSKKLSTEGYESTTRAIFNVGEISPAIYYAYLSKVRDLVKAKRASAGELDKAHYDILIGKINYSLK
ncbi:MAG: zinc-dependent metalloprotease, partial [Bacteroidales bacterium]|nr:zinc-dependent metalloprotease [Bacteroidales bacterium]